MDPLSTGNSANYDYESNALVSFFRKNCIDNLSKLSNLAKSEEGEYLQLYIMILQIEKILKDNTIPFDIPCDSGLTERTVLHSINRGMSELETTQSTIWIKEVQIFNEELLTDIQELKGILSGSDILLPALILLKKMDEKEAPTINTHRWKRLVIRNIFNFDAIKSNILERLDFCKIALDKAPPMSKQFFSSLNQIINDCLNKAMKAMEWLNIS